MMRPMSELAKSRHVGLGGPYGVGKDFVATEHLPGRVRTKVAAPLYELACAALGPSFSKQGPGGRETLQRLGAWGRGEVSDVHPWSAERAAAVLSLRTIAGFGAFGTTPDFWLDQFTASVRKHVLADTVCTDLRFANEARAFVRDLGPALMVLCSDEDLTARREAMRYPVSSGDPSEHLANNALNALRCGYASDIIAAVELAGFSGIVWNSPVAHPEVSAITSIPVFSPYA